jgi:hypothetical protein
MELQVLPVIQSKENPLNTKFQNTHVHFHDEQIFGLYISWQYIKDGT